MIFARTTWLDFKNEIRQQIWPAGEPQNLVASHDKYFVEAILDLQQAVDCLQYNNTSIFPHCATLFQCGLTVLEAPYGVVRRVYVVDKINQDTGKEDPDSPVDWCSKVHYDQVKYCRLEEFVSRNLECLSCGGGTSGGVTLSQLFGWPYGSCSKNVFIPPTDEGWKEFSALPQGLHFPQSSTDSPYGRSLRGSWALSRGRIYLAPWIQSTETVVVEWDGIKREWMDEDLIDSDPLLKRAVRLYVQAQHLRDYDNEFDKANLINSEFQKTRAELMYNCREVSRVRGCEESKAIQSIAHVEMSVRGGGDSPLPDNTPTEPENQTTCGTVLAPSFNPPAGSTVAYPVHVAISSPDGSEVFFTTDGTTPTRDSFKYDGVLLLSAGTQLSAVAYVGSCPSDSVSTGYLDAADVSVQVPEITVSCDPGDKAGRWFVFNSDGSADVVWDLSYEFPTGKSIKRVEIYEVDSGGNWVTGRSWATEYEIFPAEKNGEAFRSYPVVMYDDTTQINNAYTDNLGLAADSPASLKLYGESVGVSSSGKFYKALLFLESGESVVLTCDIECGSSGGGGGGGCLEVGVGADLSGGTFTHRFSVGGTSGLQLDTTFVWNGSSWVFGDYSVLDGDGNPVPGSDPDFTGLQPGESVAPGSESEFSFSIDGLSQSLCIEVPDSPDDPDGPDGPDVTTTPAPDNCDGCPTFLAGAWTGPPTPSSPSGDHLVIWTKDDSCVWSADEGGASGTIVISGGFVTIEIEGTNPEDEYSGEWSGPTVAGCVSGEYPSSTPGVGPITF